MDKLKIVLISVMFFMQLLSCQNKDMNDSMIEWAPAVSSPTVNNLLIMLVNSEITTFEGNIGSVGFGTSNQIWGVGQSPYRMVGTPHKVEIIYYAFAEDRFYKVNIEFEEKKMREYMSRWYQSRESSRYKGLYVKNITDSDYNSYYNFDQLIFGFAPRGMVVVWGGYGYIRKEIGRYQAVEVKGDTSEYKTKVANFFGSTFEEVKEKEINPNLSNDKWEKYRRRYNIKLKYISDNAKFRIFKSYYECYNGEAFAFFRPVILEQNTMDLALPNFIEMDWETDKNEKYKGRIFFREDGIFKHFECYKESENIEFKIKINEESTKMEVFINNQPLEIQNFRIYDNKEKYKESYR